MRGTPLRYIKGHDKRGRSAPACGYIIDVESGCWIWQLTINHCGYGQVRRNGKFQGAHRVMYQERYGPIPEGLHIDHLCRNRACVNPDHLEAVTIAENNRRSAQAKLTVDAVRAIRQSSEPARELAARYGVRAEAISAVRRRKYWADVV